MSVAADIVKSEVTKTLAKEVGRQALGAVSKALPVDVVGVVGAFKGVLDGHVSDKDVGNMVGGVLGTVGGAIGSIFGSGTVGRMVGDFIGKKLGTALSKFFRGNFGRRARRRKREAARRKRLLKMMQAAARGLAVSNIQIEMGKLWYKLAEEAVRLELFPKGLGGKAQALSKIIGWTRKLGWKDPMQRKEWQEGGGFSATKAGNDPKLAAKLEGYEEQFKTIAAEVGAILLHLDAARRAALEAKAKAKPRTLGSGAGDDGSDWRQRRWDWLKLLTKKKKGEERSDIIRRTHKAINKRAGSTPREKFENWERDMKRLFGDTTGPRVRLGALTPRLSPGRAVGRPTITRAGQRDFMSRVVQMHRRSRGRDFFPESSPLRVGNPLSRGGRRLQWGPLRLRAARLVRRWTPEANPRMLFGRDTRGIEEGGAVYVVEPGDSPWKISEKLTGSGNNWKQLVSANPKKARASSGNFKSLFAGERLTIPQKWRDDAADEIQRRKDAVKDEIEQVVRSEQPGPSPEEAIDGVTGDRRGYRVEAGDSPWKIAEKLTGNGANWKELVRVNAQKAVDGSGNFRTLSAGELLKLPARWTELLKRTMGSDEPLLQADPVIPQLPPAEPPRVVTSPGWPQPSPLDGRPPVTPRPEPPPVTIRDDADSIAQAKALLITWTRTDGASVPAGVRGYGTAMQDASPIWGERDRLQLRTFGAWSNAARGTSLDTESDLTQAHLDALREWAEERARQYEDGPTEEDIPETVISEPEPAPAPEKKKGGGGAAVLVVLAAIAAAAAA